MQIAEITRHETSRRAELLTVRSYDIQLDLTCGDKVFRSTSLITFECAQPGAATYADLVAETVLEITLNGRPIDPAEACADGRIALTGLAARNELRVVADCAYTFDSKGMHRAVDTADGRVYCYTQLRAGRRAPGLRQLRAAGPEGKLHLPRDRAGALDRAVQPARP